MRKYTRKILDYSIVSLLIVISGAVIYQKYNQQLLIISLACFLLLFFIKNKGCYISKKNLIFLLSIIIIICLNYLINSNGYSLTKYISYIIRFIISIIFIKIISFEEFKIKYSNIIFILCISSLVFYAMLFIYSDFVYIFPVIQDFSGYSFTNAILYAYRLPIVSTYRNNSIFWEAGAFQAIVNIALLFELFLNKKKSNIKIIMYILTIVSTFSTTGYILLLLNVGVYVERDKKGLRKLFITIVMLSMLVFSGFKNVILDKFDQENMSFSRRNVDAEVDLEIAFENLASFSIGIGPNNYLKEFPEKILMHGMGGSSSSNGLTGVLAQFGFIFSIILFLFYFSNLNYYTKNRTYTLLIIFAACFVFSTENFIFSPLFLTLASYLNDYKDNKIENKASTTRRHIKEFDLRTKNINNENRI